MRNQDIDGMRAINATFRDAQAKLKNKSHIDNTHPLTGCIPIVYKTALSTLNINSAADLMAIIGGKIDSAKHKFSNPDKLTKTDCDELKGHALALLKQLEDDYEPPNKIDKFMKAVSPLFFSSYLNEAYDELVNRAVADGLNVLVDGTKLGEHYYRTHLLRTLKYQLTEKDIALKEEADLAKNYLKEATEENTEDDFLELKQWLQETYDKRQRILVIVATLELLIDTDPDQHTLDESVIDQLLIELTNRVEARNLPEEERAKILERYVALE